MRLALLTSLVALAAQAAATPQPVGQGTGIAIPIAKRSASVGPGQSVDFEELTSQLESVKAKMLRAYDNYERNTGTPHPAAFKGNQKRTTGADRLINFQGKLWYGNVTVGTPAHTYTVEFDTGSSDLMLPGSQCGANCSRNTYDPSQSSTSQNSTKSFTYSIDGVTSEGSIINDVVVAAGLKVTNQTFGVINHDNAGAAEAGYPIDGVMGMAFQSISHFNARPFFQTLVDQGQVPEPVFSLKMGATGDSELFLGGVNHALYTGDFTYVPATTDAGWEIVMDSIEANGKKVLSNLDCTVQTGFDRISGNYTQVQALHNALGGTYVGDGWYTYPCNSFPLINVTLTFGGTSFPLSADSLNIGPVSPGSTDCVNGIISYSESNSIWIIGDTFFQNVYTSFDVAKKRIGFAHLPPVVP